MKKQIGARFLNPDDARKILTGISIEGLKDYRDYALLLAGLATGWRMGKGLHMRYFRANSLPGVIQPVIADYLAAMRKIREFEPDDFLFPNINFWICGQSYPINSQAYRLILQRRAKIAGVEDTVHPAKWRYTAFMIHYPGMDGQTSFDEIYMLRKFYWQDLPEFSGFQSFYQSLNYVPPDFSKLHY